MCRSYCAAAGPCPAPYDVDYDVAQSLSVQLNLLDTDDQLIVDASGAMSGSPSRGLQVPEGYSWFTLVLSLDEASTLCGRWEIAGFTLNVVGVDNFVVTIGNLSSSVVQVRNAIEMFFVGQ